jgi:hypothetical protein
MNFTEAGAALRAGSRVWRTSWSFGAYVIVSADGHAIFMNQGGSQPYSPTAADQAATDWAILAP